EKREDEIREAAATLRGASLPGADALESALQQCRSISRGNDANAINSFNAAHHSFGEAIKRASEINQTVTEPRLLDLQNALRGLSRGCGRTAGTHRMGEHAAGAAPGCGRRRRPDV